MNNLKINRSTTTLVDLTEEAIVNYIKGANLEPGDSIPFDENQLSEKLHVSRNVVREALSRLRSFGIIESRKRSGMIMHEPSIKDNLNRIIDPKLLSKEKIIDLLELRYILEIGIIPAIFHNINDEDINDLKRIVPVQISKNSYMIFSIEDEIKFHSRIYKIAKNQIINDLQELIIPIYRFIHNNQSEFAYYYKKVKDENLSATHSDIIDALERRDQQRYEDIIKRHLMSYHLYIKDQRSRQDIIN
jgi:DNA-binding FadR family transcriptional regulator